MLVSCLDGISFGSGKVDGSKVQAEESGASHVAVPQKNPTKNDTGNIINQPGKSDYVVSYKTGNVKLPNVKVGESVIFIPEGVMPGDQSKIYGTTPEGAAVLRRVEPDTIQTFYEYADDAKTVAVDRPSEGFDGCVTGDLRDYVDGLM